jgi:DNA segregation ATPase FtsK/SpoIIIE-like protein
MFQLINYKCPNCSASVDRRLTQYTCEYCGTSFLTTRTSRRNQVDAVSPVESSNGLRDELYLDALEIFIQFGRASTSVLQRRLSIGYGRADSILKQMEVDGLIEPRVGSMPPRLLPLAYQVHEKYKLPHGS